MFDTLHGMTQKMSTDIYFFKLKVGGYNNFIFSQATRFFTGKIENML